MPAATKLLRRANVTGYGSPIGVLCINCGAFLWWLITAGMYAANISASATVWNGNGYDYVLGLLSCLLGIHVVAALCIIVDAWFFMYRFWPLTAVLFLCHLFNITSLAAILGYSFALMDDHRGQRITMNAFTLFAQVVFIASSHAVTFEYFARRKPE